MKKITRIRPPKLQVGSVKWQVDFRRTASGVAVDIIRQQATTPKSYNLDRVSYLIPDHQIRAWCKP